MLQGNIAYWQSDFAGRVAEPSLTVCLLDPWCGIGRQEEDKHATCADAAWTWEAASLGGIDFDCADAVLDCSCSDLQVDLSDLGSDGVAEQV